MKTDQIISAALSIAMVAVLTLAVMGKVSWLAFYGLAIVAFAYLQIKKRLKRGTLKSAPQK